LDVVSRNKFLSINYIGNVDPEEYMRVLNKRKLRWILREVKRGELSIYQIAKQQGVSARWARKLAQRYGKTPLYQIKTGICGRPAEPIPEEDRKRVLAIYETTPMCAVKIEKSLDLAGKIHIPHNRIHRILLQAGKVKVCDKKIRRKKWVRYERRHSNSLWHTDFCEFEGKLIISVIDDASRFIVGYGVFDNATTDNALSVVESAISRNGLPKQLMTDHGTQFCSDEDKVFRFSETLKEKGIQHIMAKVKRPQSNGKIERWFGTMKKLYRHFDRNLDLAVTCYNGMLHLSLECSPAEAYEAKKRIC
jgi:putative transposase